MMELIFVALLHAVAGSPEPSPAPEPAAAVETVSEQAAPPSASAEAREVRRCRREVVTGSRMTRRICSTREEDMAAQDEARDGVNRTQSMGNLFNNE